MLGDNLGLNSTLGFVESFSANFYCRFCKLFITDLKKSTVAYSSNLRTPQNYMEDIAKNDLSSTGIKENSIWNSLSCFHVTENSAVDIMHDFSEGIMHYDMMIILKYFVSTLKIFEITELNFRITNFNFGTRLLNKPPLIPLDIFKRKNFQ